MQDKSKFAILHIRECGDTKQCRKKRSLALGKEEKIAVSRKESGPGKKLVSPRHTRQSVFMYEKDIHTKKKSTILRNVTNIYQVTNAKMLVDTLHQYKI